MNTGSSDIFKDIRTPFYLYDLDLLGETLKSASLAAGKYGYHIHYALKANHHPLILEAMMAHGFGADCVSGQELMAARNAGFDSDSVVLAGVGKTDDEIRLAIEDGIFSLHCESLEELEVIADLAEKMQTRTRVSVRVNPGIDPMTHRYITTGLSENKFGISVSRLPQAIAMIINHRFLVFSGLHFHIGSQISSLQPFALLCEKVNELWQSFRLFQYPDLFVNLGGGLGIDYRHPDSNPVVDFGAFFSSINRHLQLPGNTRVHFELGRSLVGQCGSLITRVLYVKKGDNRNFVVTDAGMTELLRPALYGASHRIDNLSSQGPDAMYDIVGPVCESSDVFASGYMLAVARRGDILAIRSCGAYAASMSLNYNMRPKAPAVFIKNNTLHLGQEIIEHSFRHFV